MKAGVIETFSFNVVDGISGLRKIAAFVICSALLCASMYFNGQYGYLLASGEEWTKWLMVGLYASLDASLVYISCVTHKVARKYGKLWNLLYLWCAVLTLCSIFTCVAYFSANSTAQKNAQANEINSAITLSASAIVQSSAASSATMSEKLGETHNNTTNWHKLKQVDDANALEGLRALQVVKKDIEGQQIASEAVFSDMGIEDKKILIRQCFGFVIAITATIMCILLSLDKAETAERIGNTGIKTHQRKTLKSKEKIKSQSQSDKKTTFKNAPDIKTHDKYDSVRQAILKQSLESPSRAEIIKLGVGGTTASAMQKEFEKQGIIQIGKRGYEYVNKEMRVV
jgi:hypothetical protein